MMLYLSTDKTRVLFADDRDNITDVSREEAIELAELILAQLRPPAPVIDKRAEVKRLYLEGLRGKSIAQTLGLSIHTVYSYVAKGGYASRKPSTQARMREVMLRRPRAAE